MPRFLLPLMLLALLPFQATAQIEPLAPDPQVPMSVSVGPPPPGGPKAQPLSFDEARRFASRAAAVTRQLQVGRLTLRPTPQGPRLTLALTYLGRQVTSVTLRDDLSFADRPTVPLLPDARQLPTLGSPEKKLLGTRVSALATSGLAQATGPHVRVALLSDGAAVADLRFDRATGILLADPPDKGPPSPPLPGGSRSESKGPKK